MTATIIIRNMSEGFLNEIMQLSPEDAWNMIRSIQKDIPKNLTVKIGTGQMRDAVEFNIKFNSNGRHFSGWTSREWGKGKDEPITLPIAKRRKS